jgi:RES domain-containing protein
MPQAWRLVREQYAPFAFLGDGAAKAGGRWNSRGVRVIYTSETQSLAALETLVHLNPQMIFHYVAFRVQFPASLIEVLPETRLPRDWQAEPPSTATKNIGDQWVREQRSAVLRVPSVLVRAEANFVINPAHSDFKKIRISQSEAFSFDYRLLR